MKERLIAFTRNEANVKKANIAHVIIAISTLTMILFIFKNPIIVSILTFTYLINMFAFDFIKGLSEEDEEVIKNNDFTLLFFANPNEIINSICIIIALIICSGIIIYLNEVRVLEIVINFPQLIIGGIILIIFCIFIKFVSLKISSYFRKKLI